ncbi:MAG: cellulose biosynthesis protein BcsS [Hyphomicrobiales bacterium]|nr:cellulose biosynthesis protein BcsS [Hyphomicrobiales bacterium]
MSTFLSLGWRYAIDGGIDDDGWIFSVGLVGGHCQYETSNVIGGTVHGAVGIDDVAIGRQWIGPKSGGAVLVGLANEFHKLYPYDPGNRASGSHFGGRLQIEGWVKPAPRFFVAGAAVLSSANYSYGLFLRAGYRVTGDIEIGPRFAAYGNRDYEEVRIGLGVEGIRFRKAVFGVAAGGSFTDDDRSGLYARVTSYRKF